MHTSHVYCSLQPIPAIEKRENERGCPTRENARDVEIPDRHIDGETYSDSILRLVNLHENKRRRQVRIILKELE